jgi:DNA-binding transcriptional ArsR family regulator
VTLPLSLQIEVAPAYELLLTLAVMSDTPGHDTYELEPGWLKNARQAASPDLLRQIDALSGTERLWAHLLSLAYESPPPRDVPGFLAALADTSAAEIRLRLLGYYVRYLRRLTPPDVIAAAAAGDRSAQQELLRTSDPDDEGWQHALGAILPLNAEETKRSILEILQGWYAQVFRGQEARVMPVLVREAERMQALARTRSGHRVLEQALPGYDYLPEPGIRRLILIPSLMVRPQLYSLDHAESKVLVYGVADDSLAAESDVPGPRLLRLTKALGDERRLRILKRLTAGDRTLHELALDFGASDTTMLHHLIILRAAGLVRVQSAPGKRYRLQRHVLPEVGTLLESYLREDKDRQRETRGRD